MQEKIDVLLWLDSGEIYPNDWSSCVSAILLVILILSSEGVVQPFTELDLRVMALDVIPDILFERYGI